MARPAGFKHTPATSTRDVVEREAQRRGVLIDWDTPLPDHVPDDLAHAVFYLPGRGWCVWARTGKEFALPAEQDFHDLDQVLPDRWERVGWKWVRVHL